MAVGRSLYGATHHTRRLFLRTHTTQTRVLHTKRTHTLTFQLNQRVTKCRFCSSSNNRQLFRCGLKLIIFSNVFSILHYSEHFCMESDKFTMVATTRRYPEQRGLYGRRRCPTHPQGQARAQWATNMEASLAFVSFS